MSAARWYFPVLLCLVLIFSGCGGGGDTPAPFQSGGDGGQSFLEPDPSAVLTDADDHFLFVANELFVELQEGQDLSTATLMASSVGGVITGSIPEETFYQIRFPENHSWAELEGKADLIESSYPGSHAMVDYLGDTDDYLDYKGEGTDFTFDYPHWGQDAIKLPAAWKYAVDNCTALKKTEIGVVEFGYDVTHEDLAANINFCWPGKDTMTSTNGDNKHGTHVTGIIGAVDNYGTGTTGKGIRGVCLTPKLRLYKSKTKSFANMSAALYEAVNDGTKVINMSMGRKWWVDGEWQTSNGKPPSYSDEKHTKIVSDWHKWFESALKLAVKKNCLIVKSAGNNKGIDSYWNGMSDLVVTYPDNLLIVANADDKEGTLNSSSQRNIEFSYVSVCAPGTDIWSSVPGNDYEYMSGTSMAAPVVTGLAGLMLSVNSTLTPGQLKSYIVSTATTGTKGIPLINALEAVKKANGSK